MNPRERVVVYSLLGVLALSQIVMILSTRAGSAAWAGARTLLDELGPATALTLVDEDDADGDDVVLRNKDGKLSFGESPHATAHSVGFVHVGKIMGPLMESRTMLDARERLDEELADKDEEFRSRMQDFEEEHRGVTPESPNFDDVRDQYRALLEEFQRWQMEKAGRREKLLAGQIEQAYRDVVAAVDVVADRDDIDLVYRFIPAENEFETDSPAAAYDAIRARVAIKHPDGLDLTDQVLEELDLDLD